jgi:hypothetical protein
MTEVVEKIGISAELLHTFDNLPLPNPVFPFFQLLNFFKHGIENSGELARAG